MDNPTRGVWNYIPTEILSHIFSFLSVRDRQVVSLVCRAWAEAASAGAVWNFTEISCDFDDKDNHNAMLLNLQPFLSYIKYLKIIFDHTLEFNRGFVTTVLDMVAWKNSKLQALSIVCHGKSPFFCSGQDILQSILGLCQCSNKIDLRYIDLQQMPFTLDSRIITMIARSCPNLHTLLINNHAPGIIILRAETIVEVLRVCPKLSTLGIYYASLSKDMFQELGKPSREPFKSLRLFYEGLDNDIPEELWVRLSERHPQLRVELEFAPTVSTRKMPHILQPSIPISTLRFNTFTHTADLVRLVTSHYHRTLEKLVLYTAPSADLNFSLVEMAAKCVHLKEVHCSCVVSQAVIDAFLLHCPRLKRYALSTVLFFCEFPVTMS
ncbi:F-box/LRR-repeat protein 8-like [Varanus komodoensis]|uniref:F-box/LRR-repeat protein 8-like n=1 Tax=Varanus komodoensis TaxID=61221 RepID=UPI001CF7C319|nr:F-box/LRR-repeat protein 8-like [Varanus komodoensis]